MPHDPLHLEAEQCDRDRGAGQTCLADHFIDTGLLFGQRLIDLLLIFRKFNRRQSSRFIGCRRPIARTCRCLLFESARAQFRGAGKYESLEALITLDSLVARARFAIEFRCAPAELSDATEGFTIAQGRHPLLTAQGIEVVPFDLEMLANERTLLISGPNTGGKTVLLKALGLFSALVQSGVPAPVDPGSRIALFNDIYADVGDEQSILASLSTFSAHLKNLAEVLTSATNRSLVLIDELGSGTDPIEGAALGGAILEALTTRGTLSIATTHLGALKELATQVDGIVNASLQFDPVALAPTYRLTKGVPGRSYGISTARRLNLPRDVLARAEERIPTDERRVTALLAELEAEGWEVVDSGTRWYRTRLRRRSET